MNTKKKTLLKLVIGFIEIGHRAIEIKFLILHRFKPEHDHICTLGIKFQYFDSENIKKRS